MAKKAPAASNTTPPAAAADEPILSGANGPDPVIVLRIAAAREGFRRAGRAWSKTPIDVPLADLADDQVAMLRAEPMLTVEEVVLP